MRQGNVDRWFGTRAASAPRRIERHLAGPDAEVAELRRSGPTLFCCSLDGAAASFAQMPDGVAMPAAPRTAGSEALERIRRLDFGKCPD